MENTMKEVYDKLSTEECTDEWHNKKCWYHKLTGSNKLADWGQFLITVESGINLH
jgi:hypothetical protein